MKSLSAFNETVIDSLHVSPIMLIVIEFSGLTLRLCSNIFGDAGAECVFDNELYEPILLSYDTINTGAINPVTLQSDPGNTAFTVDNNTPVGGYDRFSELCAALNAHTATVTEYEFFDGATASADLVEVFKGKVEDFLELTTDRVTVTVTDYSLDIANRFDHVIINTSDYPGADPDDLGKMAPQVYGSALRVPAIAVDAGGKSTIISDMTATTPGNGGTLEITDGSTMPTGAFIIQVDAEQISIVSRSGNTLTLAASGARGYNSTTAVEHDAGAGVAEMQSAFVYLVADHAVKAINNIYVDDIRQTSGFTAYTGQSGDEYAGYTGKAVVVFNVLPVFTKQVNVAVDDTIDVSDTTDVSDTIAVSTGSHSHTGTGEIVTWKFDQASINAGTPTNVNFLIDSDFVTQSGFRFPSDQAKLDTNFTYSYSGVPVQYRVGISIVASGGQTIQMSFNGLTVSRSSVGVSTSAWTNVNASADTWAEICALSAYVTQTNSGSSTTAVVQAWLEISYIPAVTAGPATGVAKSGSASKSGTVTKTGTVTVSGNSVAEAVIGDRISVDVDGYLDDGSGTYTGTPNALISRPDWIAKHVLINRCGLTSGEIDSTSYSAAGSFYSTNSFTLAIAILQRPNVRALLNRIAIQSKSIEFWEAGTHHIKHIPATETTVKTIEASRVDLNQIYMKYTDRVDIKNRFSARFNRHWSGFNDDIESDRALVVASDSPSITTYGTLEGDSQSYPYVPGETQAQVVLDWLLGDLKQPRLIVELSGGYWLTDLERGDVVNLDTFNYQDENYFEFYSMDAWAWQSNDNFSFHINQEYDENFLHSAVIGLIQTSDKFRVIDVLRRPDATIQMQLIQILE